MTLKKAGAFLGCYLVALNCYAGPTCIAEGLEANLNELEAVVAEVDNCPKPKDVWFENLCNFVSSKNLAYEKELYKMSCVDPKKDSTITIKAKVKHFWEKYTKDLYCEGEGFVVPKGNILKFSLNRNYVFFIDGMVEDFELDINFKDPADGKTLLDFAKEELGRYKQSSEQTIKIAEYEKIYRHLRDNLKAKHAHEL